MEFVFYSTYFRGREKKKQELCKNIVQGLTGQIYKSVKPFFAYVYEA